MICSIQSGMTEGYARMTHQEQPERSAPAFTPAKRDDVLFTLQYAMRHDLTGKVHQKASEVAVSMLASLVLDHLERSNFVIMKKPPLAAHSDTQHRLPLKD